MAKEPDIIKIIADDPVYEIDNADEFSEDDEIYEDDEQESIDISEATDTDDAAEQKKVKFIKIKLLKNRIAKRFDSIPNDLSKPFMRNFALICGAVILAAATTAILIPQTESAVYQQTEKLYLSNEEYISAKEENDKLSEAVANLDSDLSKGKSTLENLDKSQENLDSIREENASLEKEKEKLQNSIASKQRTLDGLKKSYDNYVNNSLTWSSGRYTVGKNIAAGTYNVTGSGSIVISNSGSARVNESLKSEGKKYTLSDGDIIKIDGNAKFTVE